MQHHIKGRFVLFTCLLNVKRSVIINRVFSICLSSISMLCVICVLSTDKGGINTRETYLPLSDYNTTYIMQLWQKNQLYAFCLIYIILYFILFYSPFINQFYLYYIEQFDNTLCIVYLYTYNTDYFNNKVKWKHFSERLMFSILFLLSYTRN